MREILFRGKREDSGEWVYGYLNRHPSPVQIGDYNNPWTIHVPPADPDDNGGVYWVDPATIGQYTGLTDKNGVKIFEEDIARYDDELIVVEWAEDAAMFMVRAFYGGILTDFFQIWGEDIEVIGNIHDNPELLEGE